MKTFFLSPLSALLAAALACFAPASQAAPSTQKTSASVPSKKHVAKKAASSRSQPVRVSATSARTKGRSLQAATGLAAGTALVAHAARAPALRSAIAYMVDRNTGTPLFEKNVQAVAPIASITKLMTAMVALDSKASLAEMLSVSDDDRDYEKNTGSRLSVGSVLSRQDMLHIALMSSENRAASALSRYYPGGRPAFVAAMNQKAKSLGMLDTHFENPAGLSKLNVSSARDLVKMVDAAYQYPLIRNYSTSTSHQVQSGKGLLTYRSTNLLVRDPSWNIGVQKTGFINESGICLVMETTIDGRPVVMVLMNSTGRNSDFADAKSLRSMLKSNVGLKPAASQQAALTSARQLH